MTEETEDNFENVPNMLKCKKKGFLFIQTYIYCLTTKLESQPGIYYLF